MIRHGEVSRVRVAINGDGVYVPVDLDEVASFLCEAIRETFPTARVTVVPWHGCSGWLPSPEVFVRDDDGEEEYSWDTHPAHDLLQHVLLTAWEAVLAREVSA